MADDFSVGPAPARYEQLRPLVPDDEIISITREQNVMGSSELAS
jgi:hypothetical protein